MEALRKELGLNDPALVQYARYMSNLLRGDMGISYKTKVGVAEEVWARFPNTIKLALAGGLISILFSIPLGVIAAVKQNTFVDWASMVVALLGISMPSFWFALLLILFFSLKLGWFPVSGADTLRSYVLPSITLGFNGMASIARITRSSMLEVLRQDYIRTARSKGLPYNIVVRRHALKNAMLPTVTVIGLQMGMLLAGSVITETVFSWPGIGRLIVTSIQGRDTPMVLGCIIVFTVCFSLVNLIVDLLYGFIDPRIKAQYK